MKRDYIYQDTTGKFKLMQNAQRIGGFVAGDQGIVPSERVLPEQRFAHQPIFRRPPEELVATTYYLQYRDFVIATEDTGKKFNGDPLSPVLKVKGLVSYQEPTPEAKILADKFVQGDVWDNPGYFTEAELITLATYYLNGIGYVVQYDPNPSVASPRIFKRRDFYAYQDLQPPDYNQISVWIGDQAGRFSLKNTHEVIPLTEFIQKIHFLYQDGNIYGIVVGKGDGLYYVYTASSLDGPWAQTNIIDLSTANGRQALVDLLQKDCGRILRQFGVLGSTPTFPVSIPGVTVGKTGEWVGLWAVISSTSGPSYVCRLKKVSGGIELEQAHVKLKFKNGGIKSFPGTNSDW